MYATRKNLACEVYNTICDSYSYVLCDHLVSVLAAMRHQEEIPLLDVSRVESPNLNDLTFIQKQVALLCSKVQAATV